MPKLITVHAFTGSGRQMPEVEEGEDDGIQAASPTADPTHEVVIVDPIARIRSFSPRKPDHNGQPRPGSRIVFMSGAGLPVSETVEEIRNLLNQLDN